MSFLQSTQAPRIFPYPIPRIDPSWRTSSVVGITTTIREEGRWDRLSVLADALEDSGCDDPAILDHLRQEQVDVYGEPYIDRGRTCRSRQMQLLHKPGKFPNLNGGCWQGTCWVVEAILRQPQRVVARVEYTGQYKAVHDRPVINPGDSTAGVVWIVTPHTWANGPAYAVETEYPGDAEGILVDDDDFGKNYRLDQVSLKDYQTDPGDWENPPEYRCHFSDDGHPFDGDEMRLEGFDGLGMEAGPAYNVLIHYVGPNMPHAGVLPSRYSLDMRDCDECGRRFYLKPTRRVVACSRKCFSAATGRVLA